MTTFGFTGPGNMATEGGIALTVIGPYYCEGGTLHQLVVDVPGAGDDGGNPLLEARIGMVIYKDDGTGKAGEALVKTNVITITRSSTSVPFGLITFTLPTPVSIPAGNYFIGYWHEWNGMVLCDSQSPLEPPMTGYLWTTREPNAIPDVCPDPSTARATENVHCVMYGIYVMTGENLGLLTVTSDIGSTPFLLDGQKAATPFSMLVEQATHTLKAFFGAASNLDPYIFSEWNDGVKTTERTVDLTAADVTLQINYAKYPIIPLTLPETLIAKFHSLRGVLGLPYPGNPEVNYTRANVLYARMQVFSDIQPDGSLLPTAPSGTTTAWSEGGVTYEALIEHLAWCFDNDFVPVMGLWVTNITAWNTTPQMTYGGLYNFINNLNTWLKQNYPDKFLIWEPCWEMNQIGSNWGQSFMCPRGWAIPADEYVNAMMMIRQIRDVLDANQIIIAAHINDWYADTWQNRGKPRNLAWYPGYKLCDVLGVSGYWSSVQFLGDTTSEEFNPDLPTGLNYINWYWIQILSAIAFDADLEPCRFIGLFEGGDDRNGASDTPELYKQIFDVLMPSLFPQVTMFGVWARMNWTPETYQTWLQKTAEYDGYPPTPSLIQWWNSLKWWQKTLVVTGVAVPTGTVALKLKKQKS